MRLHYYPHAPYSRKVLLGAYERGVTFERVLCLPFDAAAKAALKAAHPLGTIPLLEADDDVLTESSIILEYFDLIGGAGRRLLPDDPREALRARALDRLADAHLMAPTVYLGWALRKPPETQNAARVASNRSALETALGLLDAHLAERPYVSGEDVGFADCSPAGSLSSALFDGTLANLDPWPRVAAWYERMVQRPSFQSILEECKTVALPPGFG